MRKLYFIIFLLCFGFIHASSLEPLRTNPSVVKKMVTTVSISYPTPICANSYEVTVNITGTGNYLGGTFSAVSSGLYINSVTGTINPFLSLTGTYTVTYSIPENPVVTATTTVVISEGAYIYSPMSDMNMCDYDGNNDGHMLYIQSPTSNLTSLAGYVSSILGPQDPATHVVEFYFNSLADAEAGNSANALTNLDFYEVQTGTYYARVENTVTGCYAIDSFNVAVRQLANPFISSNTASSIGCVDWNSTQVTNGLVLYSGVNSPGYTFNWYQDGVLVDGQNGSSLAVATMYSNASLFTVEAVATNLGCTSNINSNSTFMVVRSGPASLINSVITNLQGVQTLTVTNAGYGIYEYRMDNGDYQFSPVFENIALGTHVIEIKDVSDPSGYSCGTTSISVTVEASAVPAPDGATSQDFSAGATLADIVVSGTNIQWYASASNKMVDAAALPLNTPLVNGTTYYATQTVGGIESTSRLPVTVHLNLSVTENHLLGLTYSPNPVKSSIQLKATDAINSVTVMNLLGQVLKTTTYNQPEVVQDLSDYCNGAYFLKVVSGDKVKVIKILKD